MKSKVEVVAGDITRQKVDAIVNAANTSLLGGVVSNTAVVPRALLGVPAGITRRRFASGLALSLAGIGTGLPNPRAQKRITVAQAFDRAMQDFMEARNVPGGSLAVVRQGRLVYAQGYGFADRERKLPVGADSLFRMASLSKPITAAAILQLVEKKQLQLEARAFDLLPIEPFVAPERKADGRLQEITVRQLLQHTGGWDRDRSYDPMFRCRQIARTLGIPSPPGPSDIIRYMLGEPLDFDPGSRYAYSNFGYCVLGRILEKLTGKGYEQCVQENVLEPIGVQRMRLGASLLAGQASGEVRYYTASESRVPSIFDGANGEAERVFFPYGGFCLEAMDAHGGWIGSAIDLARFVSAHDDAARRPILSREMLDVLGAPPSAPAWRDKQSKLNDVYYGLGWMVRPKGQGGKANHWHAGSLPGTASLMVRRGDGLSWVVLFNQRSEKTGRPDSDIDPALHQAAAAVTVWPEEDRFETESTKARRSAEP